LTKYFFIGPAPGFGCTQNVTLQSVFPGCVVFGLCCQNALLLRNSLGLTRGVYECYQWAEPLCVCVCVCVRAVSTPLFIFPKH